MEKETVGHVAEILRAIAHSLRLQMIDVLRENEMCVGDIVEALDDKQAAISHQLNLMKDKGIIASRRDSAKVYYRIEINNLINILDCIQSHFKARKEK